MIQLDRLGRGRLRTRPLRAARFGRGLHFLRRAALLDTGNRVADGNPLALAPEDAQHPGALGGQLHGGLVGLELEEDVVRPDPVAVALHPAEDDAFGHGFAEGRDAHVEGHASRQRASAFITRSRSSAWWTLYEPVAGLAASARPT